MGSSLFNDDRSLAETLPEYTEESSEERNRGADAEKKGGSEKQTLNDLLEQDVDPWTMLDAISQLLLTLQKTLASLAALHEQPEEKDLSKDSIHSTGQECGTLRTQLIELEHVVQVYARRRGPGPLLEEEVYTGPQIDPGLYTWSTDCMLFLLEFNAYLERLRGHKGDADAALDEWEHVSTEKEDPEDMSLEEYQMKLVVFHSHLASFIPILTALVQDEDDPSDEGDEDERNTAALQFPRAIPESSYAYTLRNRRDSEFFTRPKSSNEVRRREWYTLKDILTTCCDRLSEETQLDEDIKSKVQALIAKQNIAVATLSEMLTNHPSEWLEASLAGKMSYSEFMSIPVAHITRYRQLIYSFLNELDVQQACGRVGRFMLIELDEVGNSALNRVDVEGLDEAMGRLLLTLKVQQPHRAEEASSELHPAADAAAESDPFSNG